MSINSINQPSSVFDCNRLNYEEERLKSFASWPIHCPVDPARLARAGFYYAGTEDEVICFSCQGHVKNWNYGDIVITKHSNLYPNCDFIKNGCKNVPLLKNSNRSNPKPCNIKNSFDEAELSFNIDCEKMKSENERIKTFAGKWPLTNINIADLAHAGYFYTGLDDKVQCAFCKVIVGNWKVSNALSGNYLKHFSWCDYLSEKSKKNSDKAKNETPWYHTSSQDVCGNMKQIESNSDTTCVTSKFISDEKSRISLEDLGVYLHKNPVHPHYASVKARLKTFSSWPLNAPVSKEDLATAGFFYLGTEDCTRCFHCSGGLKKWEAGDDPWVEHARWFGCDFVKLNKGSDFIISCLLKSTSNILKEKHDISNHHDTSESLFKKLDEAMKSNLVRNLGEAGIFPPYILRAAILLQIKHTGSSFSNYDDLCVAASYLKERMEQQYFPEKPLKAEDLNICLKISEDLTLSDSAEEQNKEESASSSCGTSHEKNLNEDESLVSPIALHPEKTSNMQLDVMEDHYLCKICMEKELGVVFLPCGHLPACTTCASTLKICPLCRKPIQATVRCFLH